jgi:hypothetical protein
MRGSIGNISRDYKTVARASVLSPEPRWAGGGSRWKVSVVCTPLPVPLRPRPPRRGARGAGKSRLTDPRTRRMFAGPNAIGALIIEGEVDDG